MRYLKKLLVYQLCIKEYHIKKLSTHEAWTMQISWTSWICPYGTKQFKAQFWNFSASKSDTSIKNQAN